MMGSPPASERSQARQYSARLSWAVWANPAATFWAWVAQADGGGRSANWTRCEGSVVRLYPVSMIARTAGCSATRIGCGTAERCGIHRTQLELRRSTNWPGPVWEGGCG